MEQKIKVLAQHVAQSMTEVISHPEINGSSQAATLVKDVQNLQRMVGASIAALRNAANNNGAGGTSAVKPGARPTQAPAPNSSASTYLPSNSTNGVIRGAPLAGGSTPLPLPTYPVGGSASGGGVGLMRPVGNFATPNNNLPGPLSGNGSGGSGAAPMNSSRAGGGGGGTSNSKPTPMNAWGPRDESYSSGDVYRSAERR